MLRISKLADYSVLLVCHLGDDPQDMQSAKQLAGTTGIPGPTVSKLLKKLTEAQLVQSSRGVHGGYWLSRAAAEVTVADVVVAIDGRVAVTECSTAEMDCALVGHCGVKSHWQHINRKFYALLTETSIVEMRQPIVKEVSVGG